MVLRLLRMLPRRAWKVLIIAVLVLVVLTTAANVVLKAVVKGMQPQDPSGVPAAAALSAVPVDAVSGCVAGTAVTTEELYLERARLDFSPGGAAQFAGVLTQYDHQVPHPHTAPLEHDLFTGKAAEDRAVVTDRDLAERFGGDNGFTSLTEGRFLIDSVDPTRIVVSVFGDPTSDKGAPLVDQGRARQVNIRYTLKPAADGWTVQDVETVPRPTGNTNHGDSFVRPC